MVAHNSNGLLSIHNQETEDETLWFTQKTGGFVDMFKGMGLNTDSFIASGKSSLQTYLSKFPIDIQLLLVHNVFTMEEDIVFSKQSKQPLFWCFCPNANYFISRLLPDLPMFLKAGADIVLGTDSLASNRQLSIWEEIQTLQKAFPEIQLQQFLQWATINGAKALKIDTQYGSFEKGKRPGVVNIKDGNANHFALI
ncbi:amidohydrolase family protein [Niabella ginsengisoli]|uniref:Amidohydrolase family protein n=1 Tax=Niabella ginsengisoli TaxID=522298 RepID=A0ABS9SP88_9BACT|nr:amidohydrolase family protein [Niabella ginsengisoli]